VPQIVLNHHQTAPAGTVMFAPPFREPFNYVFDPLIPLGINLVGGAIHARFAAEGKAGLTMRSGSNYSTWWNGGLRTSAYFHNQIGLLAETIGEPTPTSIPFIAERQLPTADMPFPIEPQRWHFRQSVEYSLTANRAVIDFASRFREMLLYNAYRMGRNAIDAGSPRHWTMSPRRVAALRAAAEARRLVADGDVRLRDPRLRDPRGYILSADQPDFLTAVKFADALIKGGVTVHRAVASFTVGGKTYRPSRWSCSRRRPSDRRCSTCSSRRIILTTSNILEVRRFLRTTTPDGRWRFRWVSSSIGFWMSSAVRSRC
jgi:hypothetical protein